MNDERWLQGLREAARRDDAKALPEELARPLDADFQASVLARIEAERAAASDPARPVRRSVPIRRRVAGAMSVLALAATIIIVFRVLGHGGRDESLPDYVAVVSGDEQNARGEQTGGGPHKFRPDSVFTLSARPSRVTGPIEVRFARLTSGGVAEITVPYKVSPTGSLIIETRAGDVFGTTPGSVELVVVIGPAGRMPADWLDLARRRTAPGAAARILRERVEILAD